MKTRYIIQEKYKTGVLWNQDEESPEHRSFREAKRAAKALNLLYPWFRHRVIARTDRVVWTEKGRKK